MFNSVNSSRSSRMATLEAEPLETRQAKAALAQQRISTRGAFNANPVAPSRPRLLALAPVRSTAVEVVAHRGASNGNGKLKTRKSAAKRYKVTGTGKVMGRRAGKQHFNEKKSRDDIRDASKMFTLSSASIDNAIKCLPNSGIKGGH